MTINSPLQIILICMHFAAEPLFPSPVTNVDILGGLTLQHNAIPPQSCNLVFDLIVLFLQLCSLFVPSALQISSIIQSNKVQRLQ